MIGAADRWTEVSDPQPCVAPTFEALYRSDFPRVVALLYGLTGSRAGSEEIAQEAFLAAHRRWADIASLDNPGAWVRRVAINRGVSTARRRMAEVRALSRLAGQRRPLPERLASDDEEFWGAVRGLPKRQAQTLALHYAEDLPVAEIAEILGCAEATVRVHLHRGRKALALRLGMREEGEG